MSVNRETLAKHLPKFAEEITQKNIELIGAMQAKGREAKISYFVLTFLAGIAAVSACLLFFHGSSLFTFVGGGVSSAASASMMLWIAITAVRSKRFKEDKEAERTRYTQQEIGTDKVLNTMLQEEAERENVQAVVNVMRGEHFAQFVRLATAEETQSSAVLPFIAEHDEFGYLTSDLVAAYINKLSLSQYADLERPFLMLLTRWPALLGQLIVEKEMWREPDLLEALWGAMDQTARETCLGAVSDAVVRDVDGFLWIAQISRFDQQIPEVVLRVAVQFLKQLKPKNFRVSIVKNTELIADEDARYRFVLNLFEYMGEDAQKFINNLDTVGNGRRNKLKQLLEAEGTDGISESRQQLRKRFSL